VPDYKKTVGHIDDGLTPDEVVREYRRRYALAAYHRRRAELIEALGGRCQRCQATKGLTFKRKSEGKKFTTNSLVNASDEVRKALLPGVELLCGGCARRSVTHGSYHAYYRAGCRCDDCQEYNADYVLRRREDRRSAKK